MMLGRFNFAGPYTSLDQVRDASGVYAIVAFDNPAPGVPGVVDIGESQQIRSRVGSHDRSEQWKQFNRRGLGVAVLYCDANARMAVERELRRSLCPPCGKC